MPTRSLFRLAAALSLAVLGQAQVTVFRGPSGGVGNVWTRPAGQAATRPPQLQGIQLLPVDVASRAAFTQFQPGETRLETDVPGASRLVLPQGQGSLYRYRRSHAGGTDFGYFVVRASGVAQPLATFPGAGPSGNGDPIPNPVAVARDGGALLVATTLAAGGDLFEIELATGSVRALSAGLPPLDVLPRGVALLSDWGAAVTTRGVFRFVRGGGQALIVPLHPRARPGALGGNPAAPVGVTLTHFGNGLVGSADGSTMAVIAGTSPSLMHVFTFRLGGPAICVNDVPAAITDPGFGTEAGPTLALSPEGGRAAWKTIDPVSGEIFSRLVPSQPTPPEVQLTADAHFTDTLNDTGVIAFFDRDSVMMIVGEPNGAGGIEKGDLYRVTFPLGGGQPAFSNLSNTSGDAVAPFDFKGELETSDGIFQIPGQTGSVYFVDGSSGQGEVYRLNGATGQVALVRSGVAQLDFIERAGSSFVLGILHDAPAQRELLRIPFDHAQPTSTLGLFTSTTLFPTHAGNPAGIFAGTFTTGGARRIFQIDLGSGTGHTLPDVLPFGPVLGFDGNGAVLTSFSLAGASFAFSWVPGGGELYPAMPLGSIVLPGN
ncbi:MAG TPA: hypothetical protein VF530_16765 [Planctomycetota bacterium]